MKPQNTQCQKDITPQEVYTPSTQDDQTGRGASSALELDSDKGGSKGYHTLGMAGGSAVTVLRQVIKNGQSIHITPTQSDLNQIQIGSRPIGSRQRVNDSKQLSKIRFKLHQRHGSKTWDQ